MNEGSTNVGCMSVSLSDKRITRNGEELKTFEVSIDRKLENHLWEHQQYFDPNNEMGLQGILVCWLAQSIHSSSCGQYEITAMAEIPPKKIRRVK